MFECQDVDRRGRTDWSHSPPSYSIEYIYTKAFNRCDYKFKIGALRKGFECQDIDQRRRTDWSHSPPSFLPFPQLNSYSIPAQFISLFLNFLNLFPSTQFLLNLFLHPRFIFIRLSLFQRNLDQDFHFHSAIFQSAHRMPYFPCPATLSNKNSHINPTPRTALFASALFTPSNAHT